MAMTYEMGKLDGIKLVLEWLKADSRCPHTGGLEEMPMYQVDCQLCWNAKREEWGVSKEIKGG